MRCAIPDRPRRRAAVLVAVLLAASACAPTPPLLAPPPAPPRVTAAEHASLATLLELEDRRDFDAVRLERLTAAPSSLVRRHAARAIGRLRDPRGRVLLERLLTDPDTAVAGTAAFALGEVRDTLAVSTLVALWAGAPDSARSTVLGEAAAALGKLGTTEAARTLDSLLLALPADDSTTRSLVHAALQGRARLPAAADLNPVTRWLAAEDAEVRWRAIYALSRWPDPAAIPFLVTHASDRDPRVRSLALRGLTARRVDSAGLDAATALPLVLAASEDTTYLVRISAVRTLGTYRQPVSVARLQTLLRSPDRHTVLAAAEALGQLGTEAGAAALGLSRLALDAAAPVAARQAALESLGRVSTTEAERVLATVRADPSWRIRAAAARVYTALGPPGRPEVVDAVRDHDARVAAAGLQSLLLPRADSAPPPRALLLEAVGSPDVMVRAAAIEGLGRSADPGTLPVLLDAYERSRVDLGNDALLAAVSAIGALRQPGLEPARAFFRRFSRSPDHLVRARVVDVFGDATPATWLPVLPLEPRRGRLFYGSLVDRWVAPDGVAADDPRVAIVTDQGRVEVRLFARDAPITVDNFLALAATGFFNGQEWPRVVPNFVVQGGDPRGDTSGGPGYTIRDEINRHRYGTGTVGMALAGPDTGGSQFFLTHSPQPYLDGGYTAFGEVVAGQAVLEWLLPGDIIVSIERVE